MKLLNLKTDKLQDVGFRLSLKSRLKHSPTRHRSLDDENKDLNLENMENRPKKNLKYRKVSNISY